MARPPAQKGPIVLCFISSEEDSRRIYVSYEEALPDHDAESFDRFATHVLMQLKREANYAGDPSSILFYEQREFSGNVCEIGISQPALYSKVHRVILGSDAFSNVFYNGEAEARIAHVWFKLPANVKPTPPNTEHRSRAPSESLAEGDSRRNPNGTTAGTSTNPGIGPRPLASAAAGSNTVQKKRAPRILNPAQSEAMHDGCSKYCARELETGKYTVPAWGLALDAVVCQMVSAAGDSGVKDANTLKQQARRHMLSVNQALKDKKLKPTQVAKHKTDAAAHAWWDKFGEDYDNGTMPDEFAELGVAAPRRSPRKAPAFQPSSKSSTDPRGKLIFAAKSKRGKKDKRGGGAATGEEQSEALAMEEGTSGRKKRRTRVQEEEEASSGEDSD